MIIIPQTKGGVGKSTVAMQVIAPRDCHIDEHAKVLASVSEVREALQQEGDVALCRELALALQDWFPGHVQHLDSALATWMVQRTHGARPVLFRRRVA